MRKNEQEEKNKETKGKNLRWENNILLEFPSR